MLENHWLKTKNNYSHNYELCVFLQNLTQLRSQKDSPLTVKLDSRTKACMPSLSQCSHWFTCSEVQRTTDSWKRVWLLSVVLPMAQHGAWISKSTLRSYKLSNIQKMPAIGLIHKEDQYVIYFLMFSIPFEEKIDHFRLYNFGNIECWAPINSLSSFNLGRTHIILEEIFFFLQKVPLYIMLIGRRRESVIEIPLCLSYAIYSLQLFVHINIRIFIIISDLYI